jgi:hypothetical protein
MIALNDQVTLQLRMWEKLEDSAALNTLSSLQEHSLRVGSVVLDNISTAKVLDRILIGMRVGCRRFAIVEDSFYDVTFVIIS